MHGPQSKTEMVSVLLHGEQSLLARSISASSGHYDGGAEWSVFPISSIPLAGGNTGWQHLIWINGSHHLRIFKVL